MEPATTLTVSCQGATTVSIDELTDLQGDLKDLSEENYVKLRNSMTKFGFSFPFYMWVDTDGTKYITDGHQRIRTLRKMRSEGIAIPELPADYVYAKDKQEAKQKLLLLNSQYGKFTQEGWDAFTFDINMDEINDLLVIPEMSINYTDPTKSDPQEGEQPDEKKEVTCPECGAHFTPTYK